MALIGNRSVLLKSPGRFLSGTVASIERSNFRPLRNRFEQMSRLSGIPSGHLSPSAWVLPQVGGGMSSHNVTSVTLTGAANGAEGVNISGSTSFSVLAEAIGQLIASASGSASFSLDSTGSIVATLGAPGSASLSLSASATATAIGWLAGEAGASVTASLVSYATGALSGTANLAGESTPITPDSLAVAVWAAAASANNAAGTMGAKLNSAASGGVDYGDMADAVRTELQAELARIIELAQIHGLEIGTDLVVTATTRTAGAIEQTIEEAAGVVTVRRP